LAECIEELKEVIYVHKAVARAFGEVAVTEVSVAVPVVIELAACAATAGGTIGIGLIATIVAGVPDLVLV
jgi:hypothetical protein